MSISPLFEIAMTSHGNYDFLTSFYLRLPS